jgi:L-ascorbate metabolism protein UlaG (beta-lactamase superfamily)
MKFAVGIVLFLALINTHSEPDELFDFSRTLEKGEAQIIFLYHSGWLIRTSDHVLIFDYSLPRMPPGVRQRKEFWFIEAEKLKDFNVTVFVSHSHGDHFNPIIFTWNDKIKNIRYIFGWPLNKSVEEFISLPFERTNTEINNIRIQTVVHDWDGVQESAFLISVDGLTFYFAGDHSTPQDRQEFKENLDFLKQLSKEIDFAFTPTWGGEELMIEKLRPKHTFPMHNSGRWKEFDSFKAELESKGLPTIPVVPENNKRVFWYYAGELHLHR